MVSSTSSELLEREEGFSNASTITATPSEVRYGLILYTWQSGSSLLSSWMQGRSTCIANFLANSYLPTWQTTLPAIKYIICMTECHMFFGNIISLVEKDECINNGPYSLLVCTSYFISCSVHTQFSSILSADWNGTGGVGIFELLIFKCFI